MLLVQKKGVGLINLVCVLQGMEVERRRSGWRSSLRRSMAVLRQAAAKYEEVIVKDPDFTSKLETVLRVASYILPGAHYLG